MNGNNVKVGYISASGNGGDGVAIVGSENNFEAGTIHVHGNCGNGFSVYSVWENSDATIQVMSEIKTYLQSQPDTDLKDSINGIADSVIASKALSPNDNRASFLRIKEICSQTVSGTMASLAADSIKQILEKIFTP